MRVVFGHMFVYLPACGTCVGDVNMHMHACGALREMLRIIFHLGFVLFSKTGPVNQTQRQIGLGYDVRAR